MVKRAALYLRVSTGTQTVENQERELRAVAAQAGWKIVKVYADVAVSGGKARQDRPAFQQMCDDAARRRFDLVAAWSVDRISRNLQDLLAFVAELRELRIDLFLLAQALDTTTPAGRAMFAMCGVFSELERSVIRERVLSGLNRLAPRASAWADPGSIQQLSPEFPSPFRKRAWELRKWRRISESAWEQSSGFGGNCSRHPPHQP